MFFRLIFNTIIQYILWFKYLYNVHFNPIIPSKPSFGEQQQERFDASIQKYQDYYLKDSETMNANIDPILYDYEERKSLFVDPVNLYEKQWKSRTLYANTPRGNVLMYYNPFTLSFSYHSDEQIIPYTILQGLAKKYVVMFRCKDFYIDVDGRPDNKLINLFKQEDNASKTKKTRVEDITKLANKNITSNANVFATLKDYRTEAPTNKSKKGSEPKKDVAEPKYANKFVRIGKINEFNIMARPPCNKIQAVNELLFGVNHATIANGFFDDDLEIVETPFKHEEPTNSYAMFKRLKTKAE